MTERYAFGRPLHRVTPSASGRRLVLVLGAYPSALHVRWTPPGGRSVAALAVDDEPEPFWDGADRGERIGAWLDAVRPPAHWGVFADPGSLNGSSGRSLDAQYLAPLGVTREDTWVTDVVNRHFLSSGGLAAIDREYRPRMADLGLPEVTVRARPLDADLVTEAVFTHRDRLIAEVEEAQPRDVVTLGKEALAALWGVGVRPLQQGVTDTVLTARTYGRRVAARTPGGREFVVHPLAHPGFLFTNRGAVHPGRDVYRKLHAAWADGGGQLTR